MIKKLVLIMTLSLAAALFAIGVDADSAGTTKTTAGGVRTVFVIPIEGAVDHGMAAFVERGIGEARGHADVVIVFDIDTFGGQVDAAFTIVDSIINCGIPTIAFVRSKAISAGALIALAADRMVMRPNTTIGDVAPLINTSEGPKMLGEKHQSPIRAKFRALANKNNYHEKLAEAMVTEELVIFEITMPDTVIYIDSVKLAELDEQTKARIKSTKQVVRSGELLTMTDAEALRYGFSKMTVSSLDEMLGAMGHADAEIITFSRNWSERFVSIIAMLAPVLMMIGFSTIYIEMRTPGFGIPGAIGVTCLALVFFGQYMVGLANYTELLLLLAGGILLAVEVFVLPGFGIAGISGLLLMIAGMILSFQSFTLPSPELPWQADILKTNVLRVSLSILGSIVLIFIFFKYCFERLARVVKGPYLATTLDSAASDEGMMFLPKVGDGGVSTTPLRPAGKVRIDGKSVCDVVTDGPFVECGIRVVVSEVQGNRIVVAAE